MTKGIAMDIKAVKFRKDGNTLTPAKPFKS